MNAQNHTPGPWRVAGKGTIRKGDNEWIGSVHWRNRDANARLIAAAPDLLKSLQEISTMFMSRPDMVKAMQPLIGFAEKATFDRAAAAIAKAVQP